MRTKIVVFLLLATFLLPWPATVHGFDFNLGKHVDVMAKGDLTYTLRLRTENQDPNLVRLAAGDWNFQKGDLVDNKTIARLEIQARAFDHFLLFFRGDTFYDDVFRSTDDFEALAAKFGPTPGYRYNFVEAQQHAMYVLYDDLEYYLEGSFSDFTFRVGRQVVNWGESIAPVFAVAVNAVSPFFGARVASAGYTFRDYQVPTLMGWASYEPTPYLSIQGVYAPDFDPRYTMPVVGTFSSFTNAFGFGQDGTVDDRRPIEFKDLQQGGVAIRNRFPSLGSLELGLYYFHGVSRSPGLTFDLMSMNKPVAQYPMVDMVGMSWSTAIESIGLQIQGELAYRWNDILQKNLVINSPFMAWQLGIQPGTSYGPIGGFERGQTLNWVVGGSRLFSSVMPFTPWIFDLTLMYEFYGGLNIDSGDSPDFSDPMARAYYFASLPLSTADLVPNTTLTLSLDASGTLHGSQNSLHRISGTLKAKYGDHLEGLVGYDYIIGNWQENIGPNNLSDRDQFTFTLTYYFI